MPTLLVGKVEHAYMLRSISIHIRLRYFCLSTTLIFSAHRIYYFLAISFSHIIQQAGQHTLLFWHAYKLFLAAHCLLYDPYLAIFHSVG